MMMAVAAMIMTRVMQSRVNLSLLIPVIVMPMWVLLLFCHARLTLPACVTMLNLNMRLEICDWKYATGNMQLGDR
jgi:hypothetical protein